MFSCSAYLALVLSLRRYFQVNSQVVWIRVVLIVLFALLLGSSLRLIGIVGFDLRDDMTRDARCSLPFYGVMNVYHILG
jgi:hypothetical protein